jgi:HlyD family secretion protein
MKKKVIWFIIILLIIAGVVGALVKKSKAKGSKSGIASKVRNKIVERGDITIKLEETGEIQPIHEIEIKSKVGGKVIKFTVEEGDYVKDGQVIAVIEPDYEQSRNIANIKSNLKQAEVYLKNAKKNLAEDQKLFKDNYVSKDKLDKSQDDLEQAEINFDIAKQQFELTKEIDTEGNISKVYATASGTVIRKSVEAGEMVRSDFGSYAEGTVLLVIADLNQMVVKASINEVDIAKIKKNQKVNIKVDAYPYEAYTGNITKVSATATSQNNIKVFPVEIKINESNDKLKPGMTANITIIGETRENILMIPIRSIFSNENGEDIVYTVQNDTIIGPQIVKTGINNFLNVEIIEGLVDSQYVSLQPPLKK